MACTILQNARVVLPDGLGENLSVKIEGGKIARVGPTAEPQADDDTFVIDAKGMYLSPGFIDLHIHGLREFLVDRGPGDLAGMRETLPAYGVTGFLPTVAPKPAGRDAEFLSTLARTQTTGARILGFHLEGPFLALTGALPPDALRDADEKRARALIEAAGEYPAVFSISPEVEGIRDLLAIMTAGGVPAFITHTRATVEQTRAAIQAGARHATHFYDVFPIPPETDPGVRPCGAVEAILADDRVSVDFILDGVHVDPVAVRMALACKGTKNVCLVTDANIGAGLPPGRHTFDNRDVEFAYPGAPARLVSNGALCGSGLTLDQAARNAVKLLDVSPDQALRMVSTNPAAVLGLADTKGAVAEGYDADLVLLDEELRVRKTFVGGELIFAADE
ncbi:MAG: N-acetylglucosamine-6-phosphate deacetylase [Phycisphaerae bacterium]|nr:N-acetylglucosamine-6-phosphate deacetylase [Phycisphaerae bacterium]